MQKNNDDRRSGTVKKNADLATANSLFQGDSAIKNIFVARKIQS